MKISVVLAVYKGHNHLAVQLKSILDGSVLPDEIVVVDDCPEAPSKHVLDGLKPQMKGIELHYFLQEVNTGPTVAFSRAVMESSGEVIYFCDQDDFWFENKIEVLNSYFGDASCLLVYSDAIITNENLELTDKSIFNTRKRADLKKGQGRNKREFLSNPDIKGCMMAFRGDFARRAFGSAPKSFSAYWGHDHWLALLAYANEGIQVCNDSLFLHRFHQNNTSSAVRFSILNLKILKRYWSRARSESPNFVYNKFALLQSDVLSEHLNVFKEDIAFFINMESQRLLALKRPRVFRILKLLNLRDYYKNYRNGTASLLRDWLITPVYKKEF